MGYGPYCMAIMTTQKQFYADRIDRSLNDSFRRRQTEILMEIQDKHIIQVVNLYGFDPQGFNNLLYSTNNPVLVEKVANYLYRGLMYLLDSQALNTHLEKFEDDAVLALHDLVIRDTRLFAKYPQREVLNLFQLALHRLERLRSNMLSAARQNFMDMIGQSQEVREDIQLLQKRMRLNPDIRPVRRRQIPVQSVQ
jgi:hypothetical protein